MSKVLSLKTIIYIEKSFDSREHRLRQPLPKREVINYP